MSHEQLDPRRFPSASRSALADAVQRRALRRATDLIAERRAKAVAEVPDWQARRARAAAVKAEVLGHLDHYLGQFVENAEARGTVVHFARDAAEAVEVVADLAERLQAKTVAKGKSMVTEEIGLNHVLEARGLEPVETDLGEWIMQLKGEPPAHIIAPAMHLTREQIAEVFREALGSSTTATPEELTAVARRALRRKFAAAELGVSGVNFAVAETGSFLCLENEGNIRLSTTLPKVHLAVMGLEKLLPSFEHLELFLQLLPRSGTGQSLTAYQSIFNGPSGDREGPDELHVLIVDNGRTALLADADDRETLACIRCGACLNACPVFATLGGHAYGSVYAGPIGSILTPHLQGLDTAGHLPFASSLCGACKDVCPVKIDIPRQLLRWRARAVEGEAHPGRAATRGEREGKRRSLRPWSERLAFRLWAWAASDARRFERLGNLAAWCAPLALRGPLAPVLRKLVPPLDRWQRGRTLRAPRRRSFRSRWGEGGERT